MPDPLARPARSVRADGRANGNRLLTAAAAAFARDGAAATLKRIAKDAGVRIGTLYPRFPTREQRIDATYRYETSRPAGRTPALLDALPADRALRSWMSEVLDCLTARHGMADALKTLLPSGERLSSGRREQLTDADGRLSSGRREQLTDADGRPTSRTREQLTDPDEEFRMAGITQGVLRKDMPSPDILATLGCRGRAARNGGCRGRAAPERRMPWPGPTRAAVCRSGLTARTDGMP